MSNLRVMKLPLYPDPSYFYEVRIEGASYRLDFNFRERTKSWTLDIHTGAGEPLLLGKRIVYNYPMAFQHILPFSGYFICVPKGFLENYTTREYLRLDKYFDFFYVYEEE